MALLLFIATTTSPARADCPAAPIADPDDMAISFLAANGVQAASASMLASTVAEGTLVYDDTADKLKVCDGTNWIEVGSGSGADTLASLSCTSGQIAKYNGSAWACAADGGGASSNPVAFNVNKGGTNQTVSANTDTVLTWSTEVFDTNNNFSGNKFTPTVAGKYIINLHVFCSGAANCHATIKKNGVAVAKGYDNGTSSIVNASTIVDLNGSTDYVEGSAVTAGTVIGGNLHDTGFSGALVGGGADTLASLSCSANEIPKWNGSAWACAADGGGSGGGSVVAFSAKRTAGNVASGNTVIFDSASINTGAGYNAASGVFTAPVAGTYQFSWGSIANTSTSDIFRLILRKNGVTSSLPQARSYNSNGSEYPPTATALGYLSLAQGDTVSVYFQADNGGALFGTTGYAFFNGHLLGGGSDTLGGLTCATNEIPKWNGTAWACATDGGGAGGDAASYLIKGMSANQSGLASGTVIAFTTQVSSAGSKITHSGNRITVAGGSRYMLRAFIRQGTAGSALDYRIFDVTNGANVPSGVASANSNSNFSDTDVTAFVAPSASTTYEVRVAGGGGSALTGYSYFSAVELGGGSDTLAGLSCATNEIPKWSGTAWTCAPDGNDGGASMTGAVMAFNASTCPDGWTEFTAARGRFLRGIDNGAGNDPDGTRAPGSAQADKVGPHTHDTTGNRIVTTAGGIGLNAGADRYWNGNYPVTATTLLSGGDVETRPKNVAVIFCQYNGTGGLSGGGSGSGGGTQIAFEANKNGANQTVTASTWTKLTFPNEVYDVGNAFDTATSRFTPTVAGKYVVTMGAYCAGVATACSVMVYKNGAGHSMLKPSSAAETDLIPRLTTIVDMNGTTDYLEAYAYTGGTTIGGANMYTSFSAALLGGSGSAMAAGDNGQIQFNDGSDGFAADGALHWDNVNKRLGIGTNVPQSSLHVSTDNDVSTILLESARPAGGASSLTMRSARGTLASKTAAQSGDQLFFLGGRGYGDTTYPSASTVQIVGYASENATDSSQATDLRFRTTPTGSVAPVTNVMISSAGDVGINTLTPTQKLEVRDGGIALSSPNNSVTLTFKPEDQAGTYLNTADERRFQLMTTGMNDSVFGYKFGWRNADGSARAEALSFHKDGRVGIGVNSPHPSAELDVTSTTSGFLPPRMDQGQRDAIASPATGLMIFNTTAGQYQFWSGAAWADLGSSGVPTGTIAAFASATCPSGWTEYTAARGRFLRGIDNGAGNDPDGTRAPGNAQGDAIQQHSHTSYQRSDLQSGASVMVLRGTSSSSNDGTREVGPVSGATTATETRPKNVAVIFCQYAGGAPLTATPSGAAGEIQYSDGAGSLASDANIVVSGGKVGIGTTTPDSKLHVAGTDSSAAPNLFGINVTTTRSGANASNVVGVRAVPTVSAATGTTVYLWGLLGLPSLSAASTVTNAYGAYLRVDNTGAGTITNAYGLALPAPTNSGGGTITNNYGVYQFDPAGTNVFMGDVGIGTATPQSKLEVVNAAGGTVADNYMQITGSTANNTNYPGISFKGGTLANSYPRIAMNNGGYGLYLGGGTSGVVTDRAGMTFDSVAGTSFTFGATNAMQILPTGNVGIGTVTPTQSFDNAGVRSAFGKDGSNMHWFTTNSGTTEPANLGYGFQAATPGTVTAHSFRTSGLVRMTIDSTGNVGIGTSAPNATLDVAGRIFASTDGTKLGRVTFATSVSAPTTSPVWNIDGSGGIMRFFREPDLSTAGTVHMVLDDTGYLGVGVGAPGYRIDLPNTASAAGRGRANSWTTYSDGRFKTNVETIDRALDKIVALRGVSYASTTETNGERQVGFIAQEVEKIVPEVVFISKTSVTMPDGSTQVVDDYRSLAYDRLVPVLTEAIKELKADNDNLHAQLKAANDNDAAQDAVLEDFRVQIEALKASR